MLLSQYTRVLLHNGVFVEHDAELKGDLEESFEASALINLGGHITSCLWPPRPLHFIEGRKTKTKNSYGALHKNFWAQVEQAR